MAYKLMFIPNDDMQMTTSVDYNSWLKNVWTLNLMNQQIKIQY